MQQNWRELITDFLMLNNMALCCLDLRNHIVMLMATMPGSRCLDHGKLFELSLQKLSDAVPILVTVIILCK